MNACTPTLLALALTISVNGQSSKQLYELEYERYCRAIFDTQRHFTEAQGIINVYSVIHKDLIACGVTNITEQDLRQDPTLYGKCVLRVTFFEGFRAGAEARGITKVYADMRTNLVTKGFTNITEAVLRLDPGLYFWCMSRIHAALPASCLEWPPPDTNRMDGVWKFVAQNGWNMPERTASDMMTGRGTKPITGLPWPVISGRTFEAYTSDHWLVVILEGPTSFCPEHNGLLWSTQTKRPPFPGCTWKPLGDGWYGFVYPKIRSQE